MAILGQPTGDLSNSGHRLGNDTGTVNPLHIEEYSGEVETQISKSSFMRDYVRIKPVRGTDTVTNDRMGKTSLQAVTPGVRPTSSAPEFDNISVKVDTIVLARSNVHLLADFQAHYDVRAEIGQDHGKEIAKFFDEAFIIQVIKSALIVVGTGAGEKPAPDGFVGGTRVELAAANDELDPDKLQRAIEDVCQGIEENDVDLDGGVILLAPAQYYALLRNDKLVSAEYSMGNGNYANGMVLRSNGLRIVKTNRIPNATISGHYLSNAGNNSAYDVAGEETDAVAIVMLPKALLAGETIPLTSKVYYHDVELQWFIDSYLAFGVTPNRAEHAGVVLKYRA